MFTFKFPQLAQTGQKIVTTETLRPHKFGFWPAVARIDNVFGDRNLVCTCVGMDAYEE
jgi:hypothetical protein